MSKRSWVLLGIRGLVVAGLLIPAAAGGTSGARPAAQNGFNASLGASHVPIHCAPGATYGSVSIPVRVKTPRVGEQQKKGTNALVGWTIDRSSAGSDKRYLPYNAPAKFTNNRVPCSSSRPRLVCRLVVKWHPPRIRVVCHHVKPAS